jgi:DNA repair exonuclease SbcCD ATPase subunit
MSGVYESLKVRVQDALHLGKMPSIRVNSSNALNLQGQMDELERIVGARLGKIKAAVKQGEAEVVDEAEQANQLVESLKVRIAAVEAKLTDAEEGLRKKDLARQQLEDTVRASNQELQKELTKRDDTLAIRGKEIEELKLDLGAKVTRISDLELDVKKAKEAAAYQATRAADLAERSGAKVVTLESQLGETQDLCRQKASIIEALERKLSAKVQEFDVALKDKQKVVEWQQAEIADLNTQLEVLKKGIGEMSSFFRQAEVLPSLKGQDSGTVVRQEAGSGSHERRVKAESDGSKFRPLIPIRSAGPVTQDVFQRITGELAEVTGVINPLASLIVRQQVEALGETMEKFPKSRLSELLENLARDIADEKQQIDFRGRLGTARKSA